MIRCESTTREDRLWGISGTVKAVVKGVIVAYIFLVFAFVTLSLIYTYTPMPDKYLSPAVSAIGFGGIFIAGFISGAKAGNRGWLHGGICGILYALVRIVMGYAVFKHYVPSEGIFLNIMITTAVALFGGIVGVNRKTPIRKS